MKGRTKIHSDNLRRNSVLDVLTRGKSINATF